MPGDISALLANIPGPASMPVGLLHSTPLLPHLRSVPEQGTAWHFTPPGGESQAQVEQRMLAYLTRTVLPRLQPGERAVVVSHGGSISGGVVPLSVLGYTAASCSSQHACVFAAADVPRPSHPLPSRPPRPRHGHEVHAARHPAFVAHHEPQHMVGGPLPALPCGCNCTPQRPRQPLPFPCAPAHRFGCLPQPLQR